MSDHPTTAQRPLTVTIAAVLCVLNSLGNLAPIGGGGDIPTFVIYGSIAVGLIGLVGAFGLWRVRRWGALLSAAVLVLSALLAAPGHPLRSQPAPPAARA